MAPLKIIAIVSAHNEADIIERTTVDLISQSVEVYLIDHGSTDGTADRIRPWVGHGVRGIETLITGQNGTAAFRLTDILKRKEELAVRLEADWFINHDADELREAPWIGFTLSEGLTIVDRLGWNAVDFAVLNFVPTDDRYREGDDLRTSFEWFTFGRTWDRLQIRCWKRQTTVDLVSTGGHEARFAGRAVFPIRFLLRHYPVRTQAHGERKVFVERCPRFDADERARGWHVQYDGVTPGHVFLKPTQSLTHFDPEHVRIQLQVYHRGLEALSLSRLEQEKRLVDVQAARDAFARRVEETERLLGVTHHDQCSSEQAMREEVLRLKGVESEAQSNRMLLEQAQLRIEALDNERRGRELEVRDALANLHALDRERAALARRLNEVLDSRSWRWTGPVRNVVAWFLPR